MNIMKENIPLVVISLAVYIAALVVFYVVKIAKKKELNLTGKKIAVYIVAVLLILLMLFYDSYFKYLMILCSFIGSAAVAKDKENNENK